jgi:RNA polymerase sigma-70 factor (ECF subfamily)
MPGKPAQDQRTHDESPIDRDLFVRLYEMHFDRIYAFLFRRCGDVTLAEDLTAHTFERALRGLPEYRGPRPELDHSSPGLVVFRAWLYRIATNVLYNDRRAQHRMRRADWDAALRVADERATGALERTAAIDAVGRALAQLRPGDREVIQLKFWDELSAEEMAQVLGCSRDAVYVRLHRAVRRLSHLLASERIERV